MVTEQVKVDFGETYDVIIIGGGIAGVSAAIASRRQGKKTLLIERENGLGGLATLGLVVLYNPPLDNAKGEKMVGGIAEELLHVAIRYSYSSLPDTWGYRQETTQGKERYQTVFNAPAFTLALNELICNEKIDVLYNALFCMPHINDGICTGVSVETKAGRYYYSAKAFVDASGDADLLFRAGANVSAKAENGLSYWMLSTSFKEMRQAISDENIQRAFRIEALGVNPHESGGSPQSKQYGIRTPEEVSEYIVECQNLGLMRLKEFDPKRQCIVAIPSIPEYRKTRALVGEYTLGEKDRDQHFADSIGCTREEFQPHMIEIPFRCLYTQSCKNILAAGRIISSEGKPRDTTRLIAICALTGEAAGTAAAMLTESAQSVAELSVPELQERLLAGKNRIHF